MPLSNMIFMDDSKFECESVKANLPDVTVIELDCDPNLFSKKLEEKLFILF